MVRDITHFIGGSEIPGTPEGLPYIEQAIYELDLMMTKNRIFVRRMVGAALQIS